MLVVVDMEKRIDIDINWTYKEIISHIEVLKSIYDGFLTPFFNGKMIREWRDQIYSLKMEEWRRDRLWEYLNGDIEFEVLEKLL